jgi:hypothetical protein
MNRDFSLPSLKAKIVDVSSLDNTTQHTINQSALKPSQQRVSSRDAKKRLYHSVVSESITTQDPSHLYKEDQPKKSFG